MSYANRSQSNCLLPDCSASELLRMQERRGERATGQEAKDFKGDSSHQELLDGMARALARAGTPHIALGRNHIAVL